MHKNDAQHAPVKGLSLGFGCVLTQASSGLLHNNGAKAVTGLLVVCVVRAIAQWELYVNKGKENGEKESKNKKSRER